MSAWSAIVGPVVLRVERHRQHPTDPTRTVSTTTPAATAPMPAPISAPISAPWLAMCPHPARVLRDPSCQEVCAAEPGSCVVLVSDRLLGRWRLRSLARRTGLDVERELVVLPGTRRGLVTVDEDAAAVQHFWRSVAVVPPGLTWASLPATALLATLRHLPWSWTGAWAGGHVLIGRRP